MQIEKYDPVNKEFWIGTFSLKVTEWSDVVIEGVRYFKKGDRRWLQMPSQSFESDGKRVWRPYIRFERSDDSRRFFDKALKALDTYLENGK